MLKSMKNSQKWVILRENEAFWALKHCFGVILGWIYTIFIEIKVILKWNYLEINWK